MGIFSSLKQWNDECNERGKVIEQQEAEKRRLKWKKEIEDYIDSHPNTGHVISHFYDVFAEADLDMIIKGQAPKVSAMLGEIYRNQADVSRLHELEGRYKELKERYDELKKEYDKQNEIIAEIAKKSALTR